MIFPFDIRANAMVSNHGAQNSNALIKLAVTIDEN
jgi:hypothetical protein